MNDLELGFGSTVRQSTKKTPTDRSHHGGSQEASSEAGTNQPSVYITGNEMKTMMNAMQERMMRRQK